MLEVTVKQLEKQACEDFRYIESLLALLDPFLRKEEAEKEAVEKEVSEKAAKTEATEYLVARVIFIMSCLYF
jgi:hypothetical protein